MKSEFKARLLACIILAFAVFAFCTSCSSEKHEDPDNEEEGASSTAIQTTDTIACDEVVQENPSTNWDGADVKIICEDNVNFNDMFFADDVNDLYSSLCAKRDQKISEHIGVNIEYCNTANVFDDVQQANNSGESYQAVYASGGGGMSSLMLYGYLEPLYPDGNIPTNGVSVSVLRQLSFDGNLYMMTGAPIRSSVSETVVVGYNKNQLDDIGYKEGYLKELVMEGAWTHDSLHKLIKDSSGSGLLSGEDTAYYLWQGMGAVTMEKSAGDIPVVSIYNPQNVFYFEHVHDLYSKIGITSEDTEPLFVINDIGEISATYGESFGILPLPAFHENNEYTCVLDFSNTFFTSIPSCALDSYTLSQDYLTELYVQSIDTTYSSVVSEYSFGDERMLDIILKSRYFDFLDMYGLGHIMKTAFSTQSNKTDFDKLLGQRAKFAEQALDIVLRQTVGENLR